MTEVELPAWNDLAVDPGKYVESLADKVRQAQTNLHQAKQMLRMAERLATQQAEYQIWADDGIPDPQPRAARLAAAEPDPGSEFSGVDEAGGQRPTHKQLVVGLLGQDPGRSWKVRQAQEILGLDNEKSLRVTMDNLVAAGTLVKDADANYRIAP